MQTTDRSPAARLGQFLALLLLMFIGTPSLAQLQRVYGGAGSEAGQGGVQQTFDGGFVAVGESNSGVPDYDIYVVKTNAAGATTWSYKYNIGHHDFGRHIQQTSDTGYIITGYTRDSNNCCSRDNLFLLKIDRNGVVQWVNTYGGVNDEQGWCVRELANGSGYIVAGRSSSFGQGNHDAYLLCTTIWGTLNWSRVYGESESDYFLSCIQDSATSDVFAVGSSHSYGNAWQGFAVRVDMTDGSLVWQYVYGEKQDEVFRSVRLLSGGNLIVAGYSTSFTSSASALLVQLKPSGDVASSMVYKSNGGGGWSEFTDAVEIAVGSIGVVGLFNNVANGFGGYDMLVGYVSTANLLMLANRVYGGVATDQGSSINRVGPSGPNVISAGLTNSFGNAQQLFLIETNFFVQPECTRSADIDTVYCVLDSNAIELPNSYAYVKCASAASALQDTSESDSVCSHSGIETGTRREHIIQDDSSGTGSDRVSTIDGELTAAPRDAAIIASYPNPVRRGETFVIDYQTPIATTATIEAVDMTGKIVHSTTRRLTAGEHPLSVSTAGWSTGNYIVRVVAGGRTDTRRVVVSER